ncbi:Chloride channel protein CLC-f [Hibiscus syriacus]|uniref:Chloride channel protein n=1 Tax=Hibiscus syriacus TaxID=106335 RepID=A0A6A2Y514_HIBSY|nr:chloride channel protein CLC-f-like [Hibiscus syriacus]KAE8679190.1 Chloride channel protein CLC-f [Hibiscus syriacus]
MTEGGEFSDQRHLLRSNSHKDEEHDIEGNPNDLESQVTYNNSNNAGINDLVKYLGKGFSARRLSFKRLDRDRDRGRERSSPSSLDHHHHQQRHVHHHSYAGDAADPLGDSAPPEWALLLIGCLLGVASGFFVAAFNKGVHVIHEWAWAGTPNEGATWLRLQRLADTWHRILLVPVTGGVIVGMMHGLLEILNQIRQSSSSQQQGFSLVAGVFPTVKAIQAAITLGTGCSLGPEGPSVDIGKSCANGFSLMMENNRERKIALVAAGAASGIASGFNAAVAGCFFAIETVLRPLRAENSPPFTTAMIILASVISSTVSNALLGTESAFTVPSYDLKSAAELPLYLILGMLCGVVSVVFTRLVSWFTEAFEYIKEKFGLPTVICPALGGLGAGIIALNYPGILYWGFTNVNEILHTGKSASAPGIWLLTQLAAAKVVATALCKGSGLVGGLYAPSLMIGAAVGAVFGGSAAHLINSAIPGNAAVAQPQAYALVGMAATLASVCSVPLTSVLLLFELTKDYRILLPLMGAVGLAIWVPSVANQHKETEASDTRHSARGYSSVSAAEELSVIEKAIDLEALDEDMLLEDLRVSWAMSKNFLKVSMAVTVKEAMKSMHDGHQKCAVVVDEDDFLEGILTFGDIRRCLSKKPSDVSKGDSTALDANTCLVSSVCTKGISYRGQERGVLTCFPDTDLAIARELMEASGVKQLPVVKRGGEPHKGRKRRVLAILHYDSIWNCLREEINHRKAMYQHVQRKDKQGEIANANCN